MAESSFLRRNSLLLAGVIPALSNFLGAIFLPEFSGLYYVYFGLSLVFLLWDLHVQGTRGAAAFWALALGLLFLPAYLYRYRRESGFKGLAPLIAWTILFIFYLSVLSIR